MKGARYVHTNLIARDWRALAAFYTNVFGCTLVPPERKYTGAELEGGTGMPGVGLSGAHLRLPGHGLDGPTLEIFSYEPAVAGAPHHFAMPGYGHIAFAVPSVHEARESVLAAGGTPVGEVVDLTTPDGRQVTWCYVADPEGNTIELQSWA